MEDDFDYEALDPGIRGLVRELRERGWATTDSGDGTKAMGCALPYPHVFVLVDYEECLASDARGLHEEYGPRGWQVEASFRPADGMGIVMLYRPPAPDAYDAELNAFFDRVRAEVYRARSLHPHPSELALMEEVGEVAKAVQEGDVASMREEIVQVACVCARLDLERYAELGTRGSNERTFGAWVRSERVARGISLRDLAEHVEIQHTDLARIERGKAAPDEGVRARLEQVLGGRG